MKGLDITSITNSTNGLISDATFRKEFIRNLSYIEFYNLYAQAKVDEAFPFDCEEVAKDILAGNDNGKKLVLALFGKFGGFLSALKDKEMVELADTSPAHMLALLSNVRANWYNSTSLLGGNIKEKLLIPAILNENDKSFSLVLLKNPRMDRKFIAEVIRGKDRFSKLSLRERLWYGVFAIQAKEIESEHYAFKDSPDNNELYFDKPAEALLAIIREATDTDIDILTGEGFWIDVFNYYAENNLEIDYDDWVNLEEKQEAEKLGFSERLDFLNSAAIHNILEWAKNTGGKEPLEIQIENSEKNPYPTFKAYNKGTFAAMIVYKALSDSYRLKDKNREQIEEYLTSDNWCARAGAYAAKYDFNLPYSETKRTEYTENFLKEYASDEHAIFRGIILSHNFCKTYFKTHDYWDFKSFTKDMGMAIADDMATFCGSYLDDLNCLKSEREADDNITDVDDSIPRITKEDLKEALALNTALLNGLIVDNKQLHIWTGVIVVLVIALSLKVFF